jgi:predicted GH43/DUF377 family glycosyl hydrolase
MRRGMLLGAFTILLLISASGGYHPSNAVAASTASKPAQLCTESPSSPVLNDTGLYSSYFPTIGRTYAYSTYFDQTSVIVSHGVYMMWVAGWVKNVTGIFLATSRDGLSWNLNPEPALSLGPNGSWDGGRVYGPSVIWNGTRYLLYFTATNGTSPRSRSIGLAFSRDGLNWTEYQHNPIISGGPGIYDAYWARYPSVMLDNGTYKMWYTGAYPLNSPHPGGAVGTDYATSTDGVHWTKYVGNPVFVANGTEDAYGAEHPSVVKINGTYVMAFDDDDDRISYATSFDGISWNPSDASLVTLSSPWDQAGVYDPTIIANGSTLLLWHFGTSEATINGTYIAGVGLAYCSLVPILMSQTVTRTISNVETTTEINVRLSTETSTLTQTATTTATIISIQTASGALSNYAVVAVLGACLALAAAFAAIRIRRPRGSG